MSLIVTGTIGIDDVQTPTGAVDAVPGGSCTYFAAAASRLTPTRVVAVVGDDWPDDHRTALEAFDGIDLAGLEVRQGSATFRWGGRYLENMNDRETLFTELGVLEESPPTVPPAFADSQFVFLANTHPAVQKGLLSQFPRRQLAVADTMDLWINIARDDLTALLADLDGVVLNDAEAAMLTEQTNCVDAAHAILDMGPTFAVVKKGEHGAVLVHRDGVGALPACPLRGDQVIDPTGCGDSFAGGMMAHVARTGATDFATLQAAIAWGTVIASFTIESFGLDGLAACTPEQLHERMAAFKSTVHVG
jgi:sugar/nucleoside kinase (ribokinase family)